MQCPNCKTDYQAGDRFCISCGKGLQKTKETISGEILLDREALLNIAGSHNYSTLSPLAVYYHGKTETKPAELEQKVLGTVLHPERAFFIVELTKDSFHQEVLLVKDSGYYLWKEKDSEVSISREKSPREFIQRTEDMLARLISDKETSLISIKKKHLHTLIAIGALCNALSGIGKTASFITILQLESFLGSSEGLQEEMKELSDKGFIRCIGDKGPLIVLDKKGEELILLLKEYDRYFIIQMLTEGVKEYPSLNISEKNGTLCLITNPKGSEDIVIRKLDPEGLKSLINWAWTETA